MHDEVTTGRGAWVEKRGEGLDQGIAAGEALEEGGYELVWELEDGALHGRGWWCMILHINYCSKKGKSTYLP